MNDTFKRRLWAKELLLGPMLTLPSPEVAELMALAGFDWIWVELEHAADGHPYGAAHDPGRRRSLSLRRPHPLE